MQKMSVKHLSFNETLQYVCYPYEPIPLIFDYFFLIIYKTKINSRNEYIFSFLLLSNNCTQSKMLKILCSSTNDTMIMISIIYCNGEIIKSNLVSSLQVYSLRLNCNLFANKWSNKYTNKQSTGLKCFVFSIHYLISLQSFHDWFRNTPMNNKGNPKSKVYNDLWQDPLIFYPNFEFNLL